MTRLVTADAREISGAEFFRTVFGDRREERDRQMREQCIRAIECGDTYGWPPAYVEECRKLLDAREENRCKCDGEIDADERIEEKPLGNGWNRWAA